MNTPITRAVFRQYVAHYRQLYQQIQRSIRAVYRAAAKADYLFAVHYRTAKQTNQLALRYPMLHQCEEALIWCIQKLVGYEIQIDYGAFVQPGPLEQLRYGRTNAHQLINPWYRFIYFLDHELN
jgi:hypothetical protein